VNDSEQFEDLLRYLKEARGFDFTGYKRTTLMRRVNHRMAEIGITGYEQYVDCLQLRPEEFGQLFDTILINVTGFFRDPDAWGYLRQEAIPKLLSDRKDLPIRVWSAGCASGEEAYTIAIALAEVMGTDEFRERVKVYATDIDEDALNEARRGTYSERQLKGLTAQQIEEFFDDAGNARSFRKDLRRCVIFGRNDLVQDAPISRIDLLTCRNTLMYFNSETQAKILSRLHFALRPDGLLFLGKAETLLSHSDLFAALDLKRRLFQKVTVDTPGERRTVSPLGRPAERFSQQPPNLRLAERGFLSSSVAQVLLDGQNHVVGASAAAEGLFPVSARDIGRPFHDLEMSFRPLELRPLLAEAAAERHPVWAHDVPWTREHGERMVLDVQVAPVIDADGSLLGSTITFHDVTRYWRLREEVEHSNKQLELAYEELQSTVEELETTNEELQSTVEELETTNEELQSTNEELETMNEELHSMNDEQQASNEELQLRTTEYGDLNRFMGAIFAGLRTAVVVIDRNQAVTVWNDRAEDLWGLRSDEVEGKRLVDLDIGMPTDALRPLVRRTLVEQPGETSEPLTVEAVNRRGRRVIVQVSASALRDSQDEPVGVILMMEATDAVPAQGSV
jgi:two-component system CheB/CheR fusion protein